MNPAPYLNAGLLQLLVLAALLTLLPKAVGSYMAGVFEGFSLVSVLFFLPAGTIVIVTALTFFPALLPAPSAGHYIMKPGSFVP